MAFAAPDRLVVVLVRARNPANIGAVARAMNDFGFSQLRVVNEYAVPFEAALAAERAAVDSAAVLGAATQHGTLAEAIADCTLVVGTTAVGERALAHPIATLRQAAPKLADVAAQGGRVALLFGSEKTGLSNAELSHCHRLLTIPMHAVAGEGHLSMNLGQAAAVCLYELAQTDAAEAQAAPNSSREDEPAAAGELERLTQLLGEVLERSGYARRHPANARESSLRRQVLRMGLNAVDATGWTGVLRQLLHTLPTRAASGEPVLPEAETGTDEPSA